MLHVLLRLVYLDGDWRDKKTLHALRSKPASCARLRSEPDYGIIQNTRPARCLNIN